MAIHIKGPAVSLSQSTEYLLIKNDHRRFAKWADTQGFRGVRIPAWKSDIFDVDKAAESRHYCDEYKGVFAEKGIQITDLFAIQGQMLAFQPSFDRLFAGFHPPGLKGDELTKWAKKKIVNCIKATANIGLQDMTALSGCLYWPFNLSWPQAASEVVEFAYKELAKRWLPILDIAEDLGVTVNFEILPGSDIFDGVSFDLFLKYTHEHGAVGIDFNPSHFVVQALDLKQFIPLYSDRINVFTLCDGEFIPFELKTVQEAQCIQYNPNQYILQALEFYENNPFRNSGDSGAWSIHDGFFQAIPQGIAAHVYSKPHGVARFRQLGEGRVDFNLLFDQLLEAGFAGWAVIKLNRPDDDAAGSVKRYNSFLEKKRLIFAA